MNAAAGTKKIAHLMNNNKYELKAHTLIESLEQRAGLKPEFLIFMDLKNRELRVSAAEVLEKARSVAQYLMARGRTTRLSSCFQPARTLRIYISAF